MRYVLYIITALYGVLSFIAAFSQLKKTERKNSYAVMAAGALILIAAIGLHLISIPFNWAAALVGGALICGCAIYNGKKSGNFHIIHHIIRFGISALIIAGFILL